MSQTIATSAPAARRRRLITAVAAVVLTSRGGARAERPTPRRIGYLGNLAPSAPLSRGIRDTFVSELLRRGWVDGKNVTYVFRFADGNLAQLPALARELVAAKVDVIFAVPTLAARAAKNATTDIPIVFMAALPVENGFVESLARPRGNLTGVSMATYPLIGKRMQLLTQAVAGISRIAYLGVEEQTAVALVRAASKGLNKELLNIDAMPNGLSLELPSAFAQGERADAWYVDDYPAFAAEQAQILGMIAKQRKPAMFASLSWVRQGGLLAYSEDFLDMSRRAAGYVDQILRGAKAASLPVEEPTKFVLAVNLRTARSLSISIQQDVLLQANEIIE